MGTNHLALLGELRLENLSDGLSGADADGDARQHRHDEQSDDEHTEEGRCWRHGRAVPPAPALLGVLIVTLLVVAVLTSIPVRIGARKSVAEILQSELA